jgi:hypothetical protein
MHVQLDCGHAKTIMQHIINKVKGDDKKWFEPHSTNG